jgi:excinuclease ABC subunit C
LTINDRLLKAPKNPGVYFFKNKDDQIIYIGKAKVLKNRIRSYFPQKRQHSSPKVNIMANHIAAIDWIVVRDEKEALLTEANMIKEHRPKYNVLLKDDKTFPYIRITNEDYPKIEIVRMKNLKKDKHIYFGPYTDAYYLREVVKSIHKIFPQTNQTLKHFKIEKEIPIENYNVIIEKIKMFFKGRSGEVRGIVKAKMENASDKLNYEDAARYRDQLDAIDNFMSRQKKVLHNFENQDVLSIDYENNYGVGVVFRIRNGHLISIEKFDLLLRGDEKETIIEQFFLQYYSSVYDFPDTILLECSIGRKDEYSKWISDKKGKAVKLEIPVIGEKRNLVNLCYKNASLYMKEVKLKKIKRKDDIRLTISQLQEDLDMKVPPIRIEAFDNSNIQGKQAVAGMVCYINGKPKKTEYRKFNIKTVDGIDDFASMHEVVKRRYLRLLEEKKQLPDLVVIDGGKGQLSAAKSALDSIGLNHIYVIGLAKRLEEIYKPGISAPQNISKTSPSLYLLRSIRDEVHRYAVSFHRQKRNKSMTLSIFEDIRGLGDKRLQELWKKFKSIDNIKKITASEITDKTNIPKSIAKQIIRKAKQID